MSSTMAVNDASSVSETYDVGTYSGTSRSKSSTDKGQLFADSPALVKVREEAKSDNKQDVDTENDSQQVSTEEVGVSLAPNQPAAEKSLPTTHNRSTQRRREATIRGNQPKACTLAVEGMPVLNTEKPQVAQPTREGASAQPIQPKAVVGSQVAADQPQVCQAPAITTAQTVQEVCVKASGPELVQPGQTQTPVGCNSATIQAVPEGATQKRCSTGAPVAASSSVKSVSPEPAISQSNVVIVSTSNLQGPSTQTAPIEAPPVNPPAAEISDRIQVVAKGQLPVQGPKQVLPAQTNPQAEAPRAEVETPHAPVQVQVDDGSARQAAMQSIAASLSASKDDSQIAQKGQEARSELSGVSLDVPAASSRTLTQAATTPAAETAVLKNPSQDFSEQLGSALRAGLDRPDKQLVVRLHPPELGSVLVRFEEQGQQIKAVLEVSRSETGREIEQALPQVIRNLQDAGLHIRRFDVVVSDQLGKDAGTSSSSHDAWNQQGQGQRTESEGQRTEDGADRRHPSAIFHRPSPIPQQGRMDVLL